jgi:hypothetical protein
MEAAAHAAAMIAKCLSVTIAAFPGLPSNRAEHGLLTSVRR